MEVLYAFHDTMLRQAKDGFYRFLYEKVNWEQRLIAIKGPRGAGKTTMMLQRLRFGLKLKAPEALYLTADHFWFYNHSLAETAEDFVRHGGKWLFIDEVHKYPHWSREIKNIYDAYPELHIVLSASSALDLFRGEADLSRRLIVYTLPGLSFREYLRMQNLAHIDARSFDAMVNNPLDLQEEVLQQIRPLAPFKHYLQFGYLPIYEPGNEAEYLMKLQQVIRISIETDLAWVAGINAGTAQKVKKLLGVIAASVPFKPNITELARKIDAGRDSVYEWISLMEKARVLNLLHAEGRSTAILQKPEKVFLENTNIAYALDPRPDTGNLRETFVFNQLVNSGLDVYHPAKHDFKTGEWTIEVGGKTKAVAGDDGRLIIAADEVETVFRNKLPLWMFGFLY